MHSNLLPLNANPSEQAMRETNEPRASDVARTPIRLGCRQNATTTKRKRLGTPGRRQMTILLAVLAILVAARQFVAIAQAARPLRARGPAESLGALQVAHTSWMEHGMPSMGLCNA